ncbi:LysR family transcriptional regulator [Coralliovum pocilloporae]|uniref:LysR family transcriptional regulator n=1 Tax=Coralliovum pocilloporae TaxID=3066369 RepID=UPI00330794A6
MPLRFTFRQLEYFVAVGEYGSISIASEKLNISSPSISTAVSQLEKEFGLDLFVRKHAQGLLLTQSGQRLLEQARVILKEADYFNNLAGEISGQVRGPLSVGCLLTFAQIILPRLRRDFEGRYPDVRFRQHELNQHEIFSGVRQAKLDLAVTYEIDIPNDLDFVPLLELKPYVLLGEEHPLAGQEALTIAELQTYPMVLLDLPHSSEYFLSFFAGTGIKPQIAERTKDIAVMRSLVANNYGYSIVNIRPLNDRSPDGGKLVFIPLAGDVRPVRMGLVMTPGAGATGTVQAFVEHCRDMIRNNRLPALQSDVAGRPDLA